MDKQVDGESKKQKKIISKRHFTQKAFIAAYGATCNIGAAAKAAGVEKRAHYEWLKVPWYRGAFEAVQEEAAQALEDEAVRRAMEGVQRPVLYRGKVVRTGRGRSSRILYETEYSDRLLIKLLQRFRPALYRDRVETQVTGTLEIVERIQQGRQRLLEMKRDDTPAAG